MDIRHRQGLKNGAAAALAKASYNPQKLIALHIAVSLGVSLLLSILNFLLTRGINTTGGLSGMTLRLVLSTAQSVLQLAGSIALPFWEIGLIYSAIRLARTQTARPASLLEGFRRFDPALRLMLIKGMIFMAVAMVCTYVSAGIFMMTPLAEPLVETLMPLVESADVLTQGLVLDEAALAQATQLMMPVVYIFAAVYIAACIPLFYRLRFADYAIMDERNTGAFAAIGKSWKMTKRNCLHLFRLDLSFWLFYVLDGLCMVLCYLDVLLPLVGITLPVDADVAFWVFYIAYTLCRLVLYYFMNARVQTTYALAYDTLLQQPKTPTEQPIPQNLPWDEE